jgi:hemoglobin
MAVDDRSGQQLPAEIAAREGLTDAAVAALAEDFSRRARDDALLGPIFASRLGADDWPAHLARVTAFWRAVARLDLPEGVAAMARHDVLAIEGAHVDRWLECFRAAARGAAPAAGAERLIASAERMARGVELRVANARGRALKR